MWRKLIDRRRARRGAAPKPAVAIPPPPPPNVSADHLTRADSPSAITRSPSLPHAASPPTNISEPSRSRTDVGTHEDPSARPSLLRPAPLPPTEPIRRRLSLDGDLSPASMRPDSVHDEELVEGLFEVYPGLETPGLVDVSACSKAGWEPVRNGLGGVAGAAHTVEVRKENQDAFCVFAPFRKVDGGGQVFLGVFDGHGAEGRAIAQYARDYISNSAREAAEAVESPDGERGGPDLHRLRLDTFKAAFSRAERALTENDSGIDHIFSGTTAVVAWMFGRELYTAWTGDSRCVVGRELPPENGRTKYRAVDMSHDQKPVRADEKRRVRNAGGRIARWQRNMGPLRVWLPRDWTPGLAMTRSIGDTVLSEYGVSPVPEVTYTIMGPTDSFIVLASDGVWEFMTSQEVVDFIGRMRREGSSASDASEALVREAVRRWRRNEVVVDDTTAVVMWMEWKDGEETGEDGKGSGGEGKKGKKVFSKTRAKVGLKPVSLGVHLVMDDGHLTDFVVKNDVFQGM